MSEQNIEAVDTAVTEEENQPVIENVESADAKLQDLQAQLDKQNALVAKLRANEKHNQTVAKDVGAKNLEEALKILQQGNTNDVNEWQDKYSRLEQEHNEFKQNIRNKETETVLKEIIAQSDVKDINTALKLVDKTLIQYKEDGTVDIDSIQNIVTSLKTTDPILFNELVLPTIKMAGEGSPIGGYEKEIVACKTQKDVQAVMKKYGK